MRVGAIWLLETAVERLAARVRGGLVVGTAAVGAVGAVGVAAAAARVAEATAWGAAETAVEKAMAAKPVVAGAAVVDWGAGSMEGRVAMAVVGLGVSVAVAVVEAAKAMATVEAATVVVLEGEVAGVVAEGMVVAMEVAVGVKAGE